MEQIIKHWNGAWHKYFITSASLSAYKKIGLASVFAVLTAISAQIYIRLPFTPVPVTGQVFTVLLAGVLLGKKFGALSQLLYVAGGATGINWFFSAGTGFFRPTTGYLIGFILAGYLIGTMSSGKFSRRKIFLSMLCGISIIHFSGLLWLSSFLSIPFSKAFMIGSLPFLPLDIVKALLAGKAANSILKNRSIQ